jgi:hypothetical protein
MTIPSFKIGSTVFVRGQKLIAIALSEIIKPNPVDLSQDRLFLLRNGYNRLEDILTNPYWNGDAITVTKVGRYFDIIDGRHRVSIALELMNKEFNYIWARIN